MGLLRAAATVKAVDHHHDKKEAKKEAKQGADAKEEKKTWIIGGKPELPEHRFGTQYPKFLSLLN